MKLFNDMIRASLMCFAIMFPMSLHAVIAGSNESVSIQSHITFPAADTDNIMQGFSFFRNGFGLQDATTTCTFDSIYPISGLVDFKGGTVVLSQNLVMKDLIVWNSFGTINGQGVNSFDLTQAVLSGSLTGIPTFQDLNIYINGNFVLPSNFHFKGVCKIFGNGSTIALFDGVGSIVVDPGSSLTVQNATITDVAGNKLRCADDTATLILDNVTIVQSGDFAFSQGSIHFVNNVDVLGPFAFLYDSSQTSTIATDSRLHFLQGALSLGRFADNAPEPLVFVDSTSILQLDNTILNVTQHGWQLLNGTLEFTGNVEIDSTGTSTADTAKALVYGDGIPADDMVLNYDPGSSVTYASGLTIFNISQLNQFGGQASLPIHSFGNNSTTIFSQDIHVHNLTVITNPLSIVRFNTGVSVFLDNSIINEPGFFSDLFNGALINNATFFFMNGNQNMELLSGTLPLVTQIGNAGNIISGLGDIGQIIILLGPSASVRWQSSGFLLTPGTILLNGGTLSLESTFNAGNNVVFNGPGTVNLNAQTLILGNTDLTWPTPIDWQGNNGIINLNANVVLSDVWTFSNICELKGNGNILNLDDTGALIVAPGSQLTLRNITLSNVKGSNLRCADDTGHIVLDNVHIIQTDDYSFSTGSMSFVNQIDWQGSFTFLYDSLQSSTIAPSIETESTLHLFGGLTFSIGRTADNAPVEPLVFSDKTSLLHLDTATLSISSHGARFTNGTLEISNFSTIEVNSTSTATALEFGDGNIVHDMAIQLNGGSALTLATGLVIFNNVAFQLLQGQLSNANMVLGSSTVLLLQNNYEVQGITLDPVTGSVLELAPGKSLLLNNVTVLTPNGGSYVITGFYQPGFGYLLDGNQSMNVISGSLNVALLVSGANNFMGGTGNIALPVVLLDSAAQLRWAFTGLLNTDMILNGGSLSLESNLNFGHDVILSGTGIVHINNENINAGDINLNVVDPTYWDGSTGVINLNSTINLSNRWTFSGNCILDGSGHSLNLVNGGEIIIEQGSRLELRNILVNNLSGNNVRCLDDASLLNLDTVTFRLSDVYTFTIGSISCVNQVTFNSNGGFDDVFVYQSDQPFAIASNTLLAFDIGTTFSYIASSPDLLQFADSTAITLLSTATLYASAHGLNLVHGGLFVAGQSFVATDSFITFGDCFTGTNDFVVTLDSNAQLEITKDALNYKNVNTSSFKAQSSSILRTDGGAALNLYTILDLGFASAVFGNNATLGNQSNLIGSSSQEGTLNVVTLPPC
ncbi:MAG: hypothetical protein P4L31_05300 [Candidatus Babeliales bacterium]|nr:hypothetical protein [Candidatus Babeliales bacterium]